MTTISRKKTQTFFVCEKCAFKSSNKYDYNKHLLTAKHKNTTKYNQKNAKNNFQCECGKNYSYRSSLYNHKKKCKFIITNLDNDDITKLDNDNITKLDNNNIIGDNNTTTDNNNITRDNNHIQIINKLIDENKKLQNEIHELIPKIGNTVINNKVDINVFLNEECKNALSINEFIDQIKISLDNLNITKSQGICQGVSNILLENIEKLSLYERPLHCIDLKREIIYVKSFEIGEEKSKWLKDNNNNLFKEAIKKVGYKQTKSINKWISNYPDWEKDNNQQEEYLNLIKNCTDDLNNQKENKIIKNVCNKIHVNLK